MSNDLRNFRDWYVDVLESLYPNRSAGISGLMISLPVLERYIRQKAQVSSSQSVKPCMPALRTVFHELSDDPTALNFWQEL